MGLGPLPWIVMAEIFPGKIRGVASSFVTSFNWGCGFIVAKTFVDIQVTYFFYITTFSLLLEQYFKSILQVLIGYWGALYIFSTLTFCSLMFIIFLVPETCGKTLEQIEKIYSKGDPSVQEMVPLKKP